MSRHAIKPGLAVFLLCLRRMQSGDGFPVRSWPTEAAAELLQGSMFCSLKLLGTRMAGVTPPRRTCGFGELVERVEW